MRKSFTLLSLLYLMSISIASTLPLQAGGCSSHKNKKAEIECKVNDSDCIQRKAKENLKNFDV